MKYFISIIIILCTLFASCRTVKNTKEVLSKQTQTIDTLSTQVSTSVDNVTQEQLNNVTAHEKHTTSEILSSTLVMMLDGDVSGALKPSKGILIRQSQVHNRDSVQVYRSECDRMQKEMEAMQASLHKYMQRYDEQQQQKERIVRQPDKKNVYVAISFLILLVLAVFARRKQSKF